MSRELIKFLFTKYPKMKAPYPYFLLVLLFVGCNGQQIPDQDFQIRSALMAVPEEHKEGAKVLGFDVDGKVITLREGTNEMTCIADDPTRDGFGTAAYHKSLEPYMMRGRELRAEGKKFQEIFDIRESEVKDGKLSIPQGSVLFVLTGEYNEETDSVSNTYVRSVVYIPFATSESTGLPLKEMAPGTPWIMDPGTHRAHIMINPPRK